MFPISDGKTIGVPEVVPRCSRGVPRFLWKNNRCSLSPRLAFMKLKKRAGVGVAMQWGLGPLGRLHLFSIVITICLHTGPGCWASVALQTRLRSEHNRQGRATSIVCIGHNRHRIQNPCFPDPLPTQFGELSPHNAITTPLKVIENG